MARTSCVGFNYNEQEGSCELLGYAREFELAEGGPDAENPDDGWRYFLRRQPRNDSATRTAIPLQAVRPLPGQVELLPGVYRDAFTHNVEYLRGWVNTSSDGVKGTDNLLYWFRERAGQPQSPGAQPVGWDCGLRGSVAGGVMMGSGNSLQWEGNGPREGMQELRAALEELVHGIGSAQSTGGSAGGASLDGYAMAFHPNDTISHENPDYVTSWVIHGLLAADTAGVSGALEVARRHMSWFNNATYLPLFLPPDGGPSPARYPKGYKPGVSAGTLPFFGHLDYLIYQGIIHNTQMALSAMGTQADVDLVASLYEEPWWLEELARGNTTAVWARVPWPHNYEGTAINAYLDMYRLTGDNKYMAAAAGWRKAMIDHWIDHSGVIQLNELIFYPPGSYYLDFDGYDPKQPNATITGGSSETPDFLLESAGTSGDEGQSPQWALNPADLRLARSYGTDWHKPQAEGGMPHLSGVRPACKGPTMATGPSHRAHHDHDHQHEHGDHDHHDHYHQHEHGDHDHVPHVPEASVLRSLEEGRYESSHSRRLRSAQAAVGEQAGPDAVSAPATADLSRTGSSGPARGAYHGHPIGEFCGHSFWIRVNQKMRSLSGDLEDESFAFEIERSLTNVALAQDAGGTRGIRHFTSLHKHKMPPRYVGDCCEGQGTRTFGSLPSYVFFMRPEIASIAPGDVDATTSAGNFADVYVDLFFPSRLVLPGGFVAEVGGAFPWGGNVTVTAWGRSGAAGEGREGGAEVGSVGVRVPGWAKYGAAEGVDVVVNGKVLQTAKPGSYVHIDRPAKGAAAVSMQLPWELHAFRYSGNTTIPGHARWSVHQGPIALAFASISGSGWSNATDSIRITGVADPSDPGTYLDPAPQLAHLFDIDVALLPPGGSPMVYSVRGAADTVALPYHAIKQDLLLMDVYPAFATAS